MDAAPLLRWGVLGAARIADISVIPAIQNSRNGRVTALASRSIERAVTKAERHAHGATITYDALLGAADIDAVYIPAAAAEHFDLAVAALRARKHVLCEKPIAASAGQVASLIALRNEVERQCAEAFMIPHHPQWSYIARAIADGAIGRLERVDGCFTYGYLDPVTLRRKMEAGGGALRDVGIYPLGATRLVAPAPPIRCRSRIVTDKALAADVFVEAHVAFEGFEMNFYCGAQKGRRQSMLFHGDQGWIEVRAPFTPGLYGPPEISLRRAGEEVVTVEQVGNGVDQYRAMVENFADACLGQAVLVFTLEDTLANHLLLDAIREAGRTGQPTIFNKETQ